MAGKKRDPEGYALGRLVGLQVAQRVRERLAVLRKSQNALAAATGIPNSHISNLMTGKGSRLWQRHHVHAVSRFLGVSELELVGDLFFPEIGTVVTQYLPPGLAAFAARHEHEITMEDLRELRDSIRIVEGDGERTYDEEFWWGMLRSFRAARQARRKSRK